MSAIVQLEASPQGKVQKYQAFTNFERVVQGWYWLMPSRELGKGKLKSANLLGRELVVFRGDDGVVRAMDAYCPHMGAHLAEGKVDGTGVRCFFHHWKLEATGEVSDIPCQKQPAKAANKVWPVAEKYGVIWLWTGETPRHPAPFIPELEHEETDALIGNQFEKGCHPNVVMVNAIDEQHFHSVHPLASSLADGLHFHVSSFNDNCQIFDNDRPVPQNSLFNRLLGKLYAGALTYRMVYWNGSTGSVTVGPDALHFHIIFALRPTSRGTTEGQTILVTKKRKGITGWAFNRVVLQITKIVGDYFAKGDTQIFQTIKWNFKTPIKADRPIIAFMKHLENQPFAPWGAWDGEATDSAVCDRKGGPRG